MEYVKVIFPERRIVLVDDQSQGHNKNEDGTYRTLSVNKGKHTFSLGGRKNFTPEEKTFKLEDTHPNKPRRVNFTLAL